MVGEAQENKEKKEKKNQADRELGQHCQMRKMSSIMSISWSSPNARQDLAVRCKIYLNCSLFLLLLLFPRLLFSKPQCLSLIIIVRISVVVVVVVFLFSPSPFVITPPTVRTSRLFLRLLVQYKLATMASSKSPVVASNDSSSGRIDVVSLIVLVSYPKHYRIFAEKDLVMEILPNASESAFVWFGNYSAEKDEHPLLYMDVLSKMIRLGYQISGATGGGGNPAIGDNMSTHTSHYILVRKRT